MSVYIRVHPSLSGKIQGLCGNNNGDGDDDFVSSTGVTESNPANFADSWKTDGSCKNREDPGINPVILRNFWWFLHCQYKSLKTSVNHYWSSVKSGVVAMVKRRRRSNCSNETLVQKGNYPHNWHRFTSWLIEKNTLIKKETSWRAS